MNPRLKTEQVAETDTFLVAEIYHCFLCPVSAWITILSSFPFDGASLPRFCWSILGLYPMHPKVQVAAAAHDGLYASKLFSRYVADLVFYHLCREDGLDWFRSAIMFIFLRLFGWAAWHRLAGLKRGIKKWKRLNAAVERAARKKIYVSTCKPDGAQDIKHSVIHRNDWMCYNNSRAD